MVGVEEDADADADVEAEAEAEAPAVVAVGGESAMMRTVVVDCGIGARVCDCLV